MNIKTLIGMSSYFLSTLPKMRIENGECDSPDTKKSAALPYDKAADFVHSQGLEPWTH